MTVPADVPLVIHVGAGTLGPFSFPHLFYADADLQVTVTVDATAVETPKVLNTDYVVAGAGVPAGGTVTMLAGEEVAVGETLTIKRDVSRTSSFDPTTGDANDPDAFEKAIDRNVHMMQSLNEILGRAVVAPIADTALNMELPSVVLRKDMTLGFDTTGIPIPVTGLTALAAPIAFDPFTGDGSTTAFVLSQTPAAISSTLIFVDGVKQRQTTDYTLATATITFLTAPPNTARIDVISLAAYTLVPSDGSVKTATLAAAPDLAIPLTALAPQSLGDLLLYGTAGVAGVLAASTDGDVLTARGAGVLPVYATPLPGLSKAPPEIKNNVTDALKDIDFQVGECLAENALAQLELTSIMVKQLDAAWLAGTDAGGLFSGAIAANTTYHCFLIRKDSDLTIDAGFDTSIIAANIPVGYTAFRRIGAVITDATPDILLFFQIGDEFLLKASILDVNKAVAATAVTETLTVPIGGVVTALVNVASTSTATLYVSSLEVDDEAPGEGSAPLYTTRSQDGASMFPVRTNTAGEIRQRGSAAAGNIQIATLGWIDRRGRDG